MLSREDTPTPEEAFAGVLKERRLALGLKQTDLEADDAMDRSYISKLELGKRQVCLRGILHLAAVLHMSPGELMEAVATRMKGVK
jgi:transcriptional regulator with XRE-family HTH domain